MNYYDDGPMEPKEEELLVYTGPIRHVTMKGSMRSLVAFPGWKHQAIMGDNTVLACVTEDLKEGMALTQDGKVGLIAKIEEGNYHGVIDGMFLGELPIEDEVMLRYNFTRTIHEDGRIDWKAEGMEYKVNDVEVWNESDRIHIKKPSGEIKSLEINEAMAVASFMVMFDG